MSRLILNASPEVVVGMFGGASYKFMPSERKEVLDTIAARHLIKRWGQWGLIDITWSPEAQAEFAAHELYVMKRKKEALMEIYKQMLAVAENMAAYILECGDKPTPERLRARQLQDEHKVKISRMEKAIEDMDKIDVKKVLSDQSTVLREQAKKLLEEASKIDGNNASKSKNERPDRVA